MQKAWWISLLTVFSIFMGCKKSKDQTSHCRIVSVTSPIGTGFYYQLTYNSDHEVERVMSGSSVNVYSYFNNTITISAYDSGIFKHKTVVTLNPLGLAANIRTDNDATGTSWSNSVNEYNGVQLIRTTNSASGGAGASSVTTYGWSNGDMVWAASSGGDTTRFDYYTDQPKAAGDFLSVLQMLQGYEIFRTQHLIKSYGAASFQYDKAADGKITSVQYFSGNTMNILNYDYDCN